jgi:death-on-curing protein
VTDHSAEPVFLSLDEVLSLHDDQVRLFGGAGGVRDMGLLASALAVPESSFDGHFLHEDIFHMAAAYAFHITENHPFVDGNKRTALVFLDLNGWLVLDPAGRLYEAMVALSSHGLDKGGFARLLRTLSVRISESD